MSKPKSKSKIKHYREKLVAAVRLSKPGSGVVRILRTFRSRKIPKLKPQLRATPTPAKPPVKRSRFSNLGINLFRVGILVVLIGLISSVLVGYLSVQPKRSFLDKEVIAHPVFAGHVNILLVTYQTLGEYSFIKALSVVSVSLNQENNKLIVINPDMTSRILGGEVKYRNLFSNAQSRGEDPMGKLIAGLESLLGLQIDRYVSVDMDSLSTFFSDISLGYAATDKVDDIDAGKFEINQNINGSDVIKYLGADAAGVNSRLLRQAKFVQTQLQSQASWLGVWLKLGMMNRLVQTIETNMSREELVGLLVKIINNNKYDIAYIRVEDTYYTADPLGAKYTPVVANIDDLITKLFTNVDVAKEQGRIEIYNATSSNGLAAKIKRLLENQGAKIIRAGTSPTQEPKTKLYVSNLVAYQNTVNLVRQTLEDKVLVVNEIFPGNHVGEMVLVLGADSISTEE